MKWVTRARPKTDRVACPWLIPRFIDEQAEILYVPPAEVLPAAEREGARSFDAPGAEFTHRDGKCTFEVLIEDFALAGDPALVKLARIVDAADFEGDLESDPRGAGLLAVGRSGGGSGRPSPAGARVLRLRRAVRLAPESTVLSTNSLRRNG